ncbi:penicillin-binding protein 2 [Candidatus Falkowbacteria bacterium]|nr:penicillin-binding protein 2 [Candidatus Falkowbacteria bacterium]
MFKSLFRRKENNKKNIFLGGDTKKSLFELEERSGDEWLESSYLNFSEEEMTRTGKNYLGKNLSARQLSFFFFAIYSGIILIFFVSFFLQVVRGSAYLALAERNRIRVFNIPSPRGIVYDFNGVPLVKNVPNFSVYLTPAELSADKEKLTEAKTLLNKSLGEGNIAVALEKVFAIKQNKKEYFERVLLSDNLNYEQALLLRINSAAFPGVSVEVSARREYLNQYGGQTVFSLSHILGYEGRINENEYLKLREQGYLINDFLGKTGVENSYEKELRGEYGKERIEVDPTGRAKKIIAKEEMKKGDNLFLSIDLNQQKKLESIAKYHLAMANKKKVAIIVEDPRNGKIRALISLPSYDNNLFAKGISEEDFSRLISGAGQQLFNRTVSGEYPSGSTIKPIIAAAALEEKIIKEYTSFNSVGGIKISDWFFPDWKAGGHGITDVRKALSESVNTFFYIIGGGYGDFKGLGVYKIKEYAEKFGLNALSGIRLNNEKTGFLPTPEWKYKKKHEDWYIGDTYHLAIGQGDLLVTPLQVANYTAAFANGGVLYQPQIVERYFDQTQNKLVQVEKEILRKDIVSQENINIVRQGLRQTVTSGSAKKLRSLPVAAAAKTGTAEWSEGKSPHAWFTAFAPYNEPEIVITVLVEEGGEGSAIAQDIAFDFLNWYFRK